MSMETPQLKKRNLKLEKDLTPEERIALANIMAMEKEEALQEEQRKAKAKWVREQIRAGKSREQAEDSYDEYVEKTALADFKKFQDMYPPDKDQARAA